MNCQNVWVTHVCYSMSFWITLDVVCVTYLSCFCGASSASHVRSMWAALREKVPYVLNRRARPSFGMTPTF